MPLTQSFTLSNNNVTTSTFNVNDTSTGADAAVVNRLLYIYDANGSLFTGAPIQFPLSAGNQISPAILTQDFAFTARMDWLDINGVPLYTSSIVGVFTGFLEWFFYGLTQSISARPAIMNNTRFLFNYSNLRNFIDSANQAIVIAGSVVNSQAMILLGQNLYVNQTLYF